MSKQMIALRGLTFGYYATQAILLPLLPIYFKQIGYTPQDIGLFMMVGPFVSVFAQPLWGYISDRFQTLKKLVLVLWLLTIASSVGLFYAHGFAPTLAFVLLMYFFMLPSTPLLDSLSIKSTKEAGVSYGSIRLWGSLGFALVAVISGFALDSLGGILNIKYMYWAIWILPLALLFFLKDEKSRGPRLALGALAQLAQNRPFLWFLLLVFLLSVPHRMNDALFGIYLSDLHAEDWLVSLAWAISAVSEAVTFAFFYRYMHKYHELALLGIVSFLFAVRWAVYAAVPNPWVLTLMQTTHAVTFAVFWLVSVQYCVRLVPEELRSTGQSLLSAVFLGLAGITGGYFGGLIQSAWGGSRMYGLGAVLSAAASVLFLATHSVYRKKGIG